MAQRYHSGTLRSTNESEPSEEDLTIRNVIGIAIAATGALSIGPDGCPMVKWEMVSSRLKLVRAELAQLIEKKRNESEKKSNDVFTGLSEPQGTGMTAAATLESTIEYIKSERNRKSFSTWAFGECPKPGANGPRVIATFLLRRVSR